MSRNRFDDEFTVYVISSASMQIFGSNTLASFRNFFNDEIQLSGVWRVTLSEKIFPTKIEHAVNEDLIAYSLKGDEVSQKNLFWCLCHFSALQWRKTVLHDWQFWQCKSSSSTIKRTIGLPNFSFREIKSAGKNEKILVSMKESLFLWTGIPDERGLKNCYKMGTITSKYDEKWWDKSILWRNPCWSMRGKSPIIHL